MKTTLCMLFLVLLSSSLYSQNNPFYIQNVQEKERALYWLFTSANLGYNSAKEAISLENLENEYNTFFVLDSDYPIKDLQESDLPYYKNEALRGSGVAAKVIAYGFVGSIIF